jgi:large subunit ribosomal protein L10
MNREQKAAVVASLKNSFAQSNASFVVKYPGLTVEQMQKLRNDLRAEGATLKVTKARLMKLAADGNPGAEVMVPYFKEQVGLVFANQEAPSVAKVLSDFAKDNEALSIIVGSLDQNLLTQADVVRIASLPSKEVLLAQLCGTLNAPITGLARALTMMQLKLLWALTRIGEKKQ